LRVRSLAFSENGLGNLTHQGQIDAGLVISLEVQEGLNELTLVDANEFPGLTLEIPDSNVRKQLESRTESALGHPGPTCDAAQSSGLAIEKTDQTIAFAQWKSAQDNSFRLLKRHSFSGGLPFETQGKQVEPASVVGAPTDCESPTGEIARRNSELGYLPYQEARRN